SSKGPQAARYRCQSLRRLHPQPLSPGPLRFAKVSGSDGPGERGAVCVRSGASQGSMSSGSVAVQRGNLTLEEPVGGALAVAPGADADHFEFVLGAVQGATADAQ